MLQQLIRAIVILLCSAFSAQAAEIRFGFHLDLPRGLPPMYRFLYDLTPVKESEITADIDIPGLPVVHAQRMVYVVYAQPKPNGWEGATFTWYENGDCSIMNVHVAIRAGNETLPVLYNELYQLGFRRAVIRSGVGLCQAERDKGQLLFSFAGRQWNNGQLEEAVSEIGTIRAAVKLKRPEVIRARYREVMAIDDVEQYRLIQFLMRRAQGDPKQYEADLVLAVKSFLERNVNK